MKLSESTVEILKNFSTINQGLVVKPGNRLRTISSTKTILADAEIGEEFSAEFGVYDLNKMLALLSMSKGEPEVTINQDHLAFTNLAGAGKTRMKFTEPKLILAPPAKNIQVPAYEVNFKLTEEVLSWIFDVASILKCPNIVVESVLEGEQGEIVLRAMDVKGEIEDSAEVVVGTTNRSFRAVLKIENLKLIPQEYHVEIASKGVSKFTSVDKKLTYWIALEQASSKFE